VRVTVAYVYTVVANFNEMYPNDNEFGYLKTSRKYRCFLTANFFTSDGKTFLFYSFFIHTVYFVAHT